MHLHFNEKCLISSISAPYTVKTTFLRAILVLITQSSMIYICVSFWFSQLIIPETVFRSARPSIHGAGVRVEGRILFSILRSSVT